MDILFNSTYVLLLSALQVAFGSLYRDDVLIKPSRVIAILAAACMLQLVSIHIIQRKDHSCIFVSKYIFQKQK